MHSTISPIDGEENDRFGCAVSISGDYAIIGATGKSPAGAAYIFVCQNNTWIQQEKLTPNDEKNVSEFGFSVDINTNYAIVGVKSGYYESSYGVAYIYKRNNTKWDLITKLLPDSPSGGGGYQIGYPVSITNKYAVIGSPSENHGYITIFQNINDTWKPYLRFQSENGRYGNAVLIDNEFCMISSLSASNGKGKAFINDISKLSGGLVSISGKITDSHNEPVQNVSIYGKKKDKNFEFLCKTDSLGNYLFKVLCGWDGEIKIQKESLIFNAPYRKIFERVTNDIIDQNFSIQSYYCSGYVKDIAGNPISAIKISFINEGGHTYTNSAGYFSHIVYNNWSGYAKPEGRGFKFTPDIINYKNVDNNFLNQNFIGHKKIVFGYVLDENNKPIQGINMNFSTGNSVITDGSGFYNKEIDYNWSGTITPELKGFKFQPPSRSFENVVIDIPDQNFIRFQNQPLLSVDPTKLDISAESGTKNILIKTEEIDYWTANVHPSSSWINVIKIDNNIKVSYSKNTQNYGRYALILIKSGEITKSVEVIQAFNSSSNGFNPPDWKVEPSDFRYQGNINAIVKDINNNILQSDNDLLGAFVDNQCRGVVSPSPSADGKRFFLQIWSNKTNEILSFKYYDSMNNNMYKDVLPEVQFIPDLELGNILNPFELKLQRSQPIPDANNDGRVDVIDAIEVLKFIVE